MHLVNTAKPSAREWRRNKRGANRRPSIRRPLAACNKACRTGRRPGRLRRSKAALALPERSLFLFLLATRGGPGLLACGLRLRRGFGREREGAEKPAQEAQGLPFKLALALGGHGLGRASGGF